MYINKIERSTDSLVLCEALNGTYIAILNKNIVRYT